MDSQLSLFSAAEQWQVIGRPPEGLSPEMSESALSLWQDRIGDFQRGIRFLPVEEQTSLFDGATASAEPSSSGKQSVTSQTGRVAEVGAPYGVSPSPSGASANTATHTATHTAANTADIAGLDPFMLPQKNINFWQAPVQEAGVAALYFVIDYERSLLLYVGETIHSNKRWKGVHDCKRYLANYRQVHYDYGLTTQLGIAFWPHAPKATRARQRLEAQLIKKWRSPFNKENWSFWGTPFVGGKIETGD